MLTSFALEFDNAEEMEQVANKLWKRHKITGEMQMVPLDQGRWLLNIHSEKNLRQSTIEGLQGKRVAVKAPFAEKKKE